MVCEVTGVDPRRRLARHPTRHTPLQHVCDRVGRPRGYGRKGLCHLDRDYECGECPEADRGLFPPYRDRTTAPNEPHLLRGPSGPDS